MSKAIKWISHRGYCADATENSRKAFLQAIQNGFQFLETDFQLTKDKHIVLAHDEDLSRLCARPEKISQLTRSELKQMKFVSSSDSFLFLDELLDEFKDYGWTFDIKKPQAEEVISQFAKIIDKRNLKSWVKDRVVFLTWDSAHEKMAREFFPDAKFYARFSECRRAGMALLGNMPWIAGIKPNRIYSLPAQYWGMNFFRKDFVSAYHQRGTQALAFLPETETLTRKAMEAGFDEILTNDLILS